MLKLLSIRLLKFFLAGHGMSGRMGKYFALAVLVGVLTGFVTVGFYWMIGLAKSLVETCCGHEFVCTLAMPGASRALWTRSALLDPGRWLLVFLPALGAVLGCLLLRRFARVEHARGTDSAVRAFHRGEAIPRTVIPVKSVASVLTVGLGGSAGYEGPVTLLGAACGSVVNRWFHLSPRESRILMAAGLGAGIAALFRAPLAGAIFGSEIFYSSSDIEADTIMPSVVASVMSYTVFAAFFGWDPLFAMSQQNLFAFKNGLRLLPYLLLALVVVFGARLYISIFRGMERWFAARSWPVWARAGLGGLLVGLIGFAVPDILGSSYSTITAAFGGGGLYGHATTSTLLGFLLFFFLKCVATALTVGSGGSGGVFAPALACGGALGAATGLFCQQVLPASVGIHPASFALVGMAAFMASAIRVPLTAVVMVSEISGNHQLLVPTMWVCGIAFWLNNGWSLYRSQVHSRESSPLHS